VWYAFHESGVHATIAGVLLGLLTPARSSLSHEDATVVFDRASAVVRAETLTGTGDYRDRVECVRRLRWISREAVSPLEFVERALHPWVGFVIMPLFALANAGVVFDRSDIADPVALAVIGGLVVGKPLGIVVASWIAVTARLARKPANLSWGAIAGGGCLAGIGFTMALFIAGLALEGHALDAAKFGILIASAISGVLGMATLFVVLRPANAAASTH
jgi:NhaA family Na+:H+ antiporter